MSVTYTINNAYKTYIRAGFTDIGARAMLINMLAESGGYSNNLENTANNKWHISDNEATNQINNGTLKIPMGYGYGFYQWTFPSRQIGLKNYADNLGVSIDNEDMQIAYSLKELSEEYEYRELFNYLKTTSDLREAVYKVMKVYEKPAVLNLDDRMSHEIEVTKALKMVVNEKPKEDSKDNTDNKVHTFSRERTYHLQVILKESGYDGCSIDGFMGPNTVKELEKLISDLKNML